MTVNDYAKINGFESVKETKSFRGKKCWTAIYKPPGTTNDTYYIGFPKYIIEDVDGFRFLTYSEAMDQLRSEIN